MQIKTKSCYYLGFTFSFMCRSLCPVTKLLGPNMVTAVSKLV